MYSTSSRSSPYVPVRYLRLMYLTSAGGKGVSLDLDLGETPIERNSKLDSVEADIANCIDDINARIEMGDLKAWGGCDRKFCDCKYVRRAFKHGLLAA